MEKEQKKLSLQWSVFSTKSKEQQTSDLSKIVNSLSKNQSIIGIILFGSQARGDYDEFSDYDLLIIFENKQAMWQNWEDLFQTVSTLKMNLHAIPETFEELKNANPVFLQQLYNHGKVLYAKIPFQTFLAPVNLEQFKLITYDMRNLTYPQKMKASYYLYSKQGNGAITKAKGTKISDGCIIIPNDKADEIIDRLAAYNVKTHTTIIFMNTKHTPKPETNQTKHLKPPQVTK